MRATRRAFVDNRRSNLFTSNLISIIVDNISELNDKIVAGYCASSTECDVMPSLLDAYSGPIGIALPFANTRDENIEFKLWRAGDPLEMSPLGFHQPCEAANPVQPDIILTPLLAFDRQLNRLGQGAGHYDRAFARLPTALRIGVGWSIQEYDALPLEPWDLPLHAIITEIEVISPDRERRK